MSDDDARFQLAATATRRIVHQCRTHVHEAVARLADRFETAPSSTAYGTDAAAASQGQHRLSVDWKIDYTETTSNALRSHLNGLDVILKEDTFYPIPAMTITRAIAEVAASTSWSLASHISADERAARGYAGLFRSMDKVISSSLESDATRQAEIREALIASLESRRVRVVRRVVKEVQTKEVAQIIVGRAHAKTGFQYSRRVLEEIPAVGETYSGMSGVAHGEPLHLSTSWLVPDTYARLIGLVVHESVEAWSRAVHGWVGVQPGPFVNPRERQKLLQSIPAKYRASFESNQNR